MLYPLFAWRGAIAERSTAAKRVVSSVTRTSSTVTERHCASCANAKRTISSGADAPAVNPMTWLIATFRAACTGEPIHWGQFGLACLFSAVAFIGGCLYFRRVERDFADII